MGENIEVEATYVAYTFGAVRIRNENINAWIPRWAIQEMTGDIEKGGLVRVTMPRTMYNQKKHH